MKNINFEDYPIGTKIQVIDKYGYYVSEICGIIVSHLGEGHAVINNFNGNYYSTISIRSNRPFQIQTI